MKRVLVAIISSLALFAQFATAEQQSSQDFSKAAVVIKTFDRTMYYPNTASNNPINVTVSITNNGSDTLRFKLADERMFSLDFSANDIKNTKVKPTQYLTERRSSKNSIYYRDITIESGETYSFVENVKNYIDFETPSIYYLQLDFYPDLYKSKNVKITSNRLSLDIRPAPIVSTASALPVENETESVLKPEAISPDKVVEQTIIARQKSLWNQFFLYMDLEEMLKRNSETARRYRNAGADERRRMLDAYKADLMQEKIDHDVVTRPSKFVIEKTAYSQTDGTVTVKEWFKYPNFTEVKRYVYNIRQRDGIWQIYNYTVTNIGTE
ncbi:MAG: hypothetical protein IJ717_06195 [Treponema sp.]|nr:hypothetical protein [Treponema sp.]MBR1714516.1 hypothetical protein [Treponema sp.]